jgi:membrane-associated PAP2 superfamily phosphatase
MYDSFFHAAPIASPRPLPVAGAIDLRSHLAVPLAAFALAVSMVWAFGLDWRLAHGLYAWEGYRWVLKQAFLTQRVLHRLGHDLSIAAWAGVALAWLASLRRGGLSPWRRPLGYLTLSVLVSTSLVSAIKAWSNLDCPWDIDGLGGTRPHLGLFDLRPANLPDAACFPAGHASGGYAWMALYFFFLMTRPELRWRGLTVGVASGGVFGIAQQLRGAHFLSHDLWTAAICWATALGLFLWLRPKTDADRAPR